MEEMEKTDIQVNQQNPAFVKQANIKEDS